MTQTVRMVRRRARIHLTVVVTLVGLGACGGLRQRDTRAAAPKKTDSTTVRGAPRSDSVVSAARDSAARDSAKSGASRADSLGPSRDSTPSGDSVTTAAKTAKKKAPPASRTCVLDFAASPPETRLIYSRVSETVSNTFIGGGFVGNCQGENNRLRADSAEQFQQIGVVNLYGNVVYLEPGKMEIRANHAIYFTREGRLYADGNVTATQLATGSSFVGPSIEYTRAGPGNVVARTVAPQRSLARLIERDSLGQPQPPVTVEANRFEDLGDSTLLAWGDVRIVRQNLVGQSDSAAFDKGSERARLVRIARLVNRDTAQSFTLVGDTIDLFSTNRRLDRVVSRHKASATSNSMVIGAEIIDLRLTEQQLREAFAFGPGRAKATTPQQDVEADSMRILLADKQVREVRAIGGARALGVPDSLTMTTTERDLLRGDSVLAFFDSTTSPDDTVSRARVREIRALGNANALFHLANAKGKTAPPGINYVRGVRIEVHFDTGAVREVRVDSAASGIYIEPAPDSLADSSGMKAKPESRSSRTAPRGTRTPATPPKRTPPPPVALYFTPSGGRFAPAFSSRVFS